MGEGRAFARAATSALLLVLAANAPAAAPLRVMPQPLIERGPLEVRLEGPFGQPAPMMQIRIEGREIIVQTSWVDFVDPALPQVESVSARTIAPAAGIYELLDVRCAGNPPPPLPGCTVVERRTIEVGPVPPIPSGSLASLSVLVLGCAEIARRALRRA